MSIILSLEGDLFKVVFLELIGLRNMYFSICCVFFVEIFILLLEGIWEILVVIGFKLCDNLENF